jgi:hypothetical protein
LISKNASEAKKGVFPNPARKKKLTQNVEVFKPIKK